MANQIVKMNFEELKDNAADFLTTFNPEAIHHMRVATRRLALQLRLSKEYFQPKPKTFEKISKNWAQSLEKNEISMFSSNLFSIQSTPNLFLLKYGIEKLTECQKKNRLILKSKKIRT